MDIFRFKQFQVRQDFSAMRVNTDAVLLGAWLSLPQGAGPVKALDIGTGTGLIALMVAQRLSQQGIRGEVHGVEIDPGACRDASYNFSQAPWPETAFRLYPGAVQDFSQHCPCRFDLIFTNPPYFADALKNPDETKSMARHTDSLSQGELLFHAAKLMKEGGVLALVLPAAEAEEFLRKTGFLAAAAARNGRPAFVPQRICRVHTVERKPAKRYLMEFRYVQPSAAGADMENAHISRLTMMSGGSYTDEYARLTGDFYLRF